MLARQVPRTHRPLLGNSPLSSLEPTTVPPRNPPPATTDRVNVADSDDARPSTGGLQSILGVRPNSPYQTTTVLWSNPFWARSSKSVARPLSKRRHQVLQGPEIVVMRVPSAHD